MKDWCPASSPSPRIWRDLGVRQDGESDGALLESWIMFRVRMLMSLVAGSCEGRAPQSAKKRNINTKATEENEGRQRHITYGQDEAFRTQIKHLWPSHQDCTKTINFGWSFPPFESYLLCTGVGSAPIRENIYRAVKATFARECRRHCGYGFHWCFGDLSAYSGSVPSVVCW